MNQTKKCGILSAVLVIVLCLSLMVGSTFALFTAKDEVNVALTAGNVDVTANLVAESLKTWSLYETEEDARTDGTFVNGGTAEITDEANVVLNRMTPGDVAKFTIDVTNSSDVHVLYRVRMISNALDDVADLTPALRVNARIEGTNYPVTGTENATLWKGVAADTAIEDIEVTVSFPDAADNNNYKQAKAEITFVVEAVQGNARVADHAVTDAAALESNGLPIGILTGNGETIATNNSLMLQGTTTLQDITVDGSNAETATIASNGAASDLVLRSGTSVVAPADPDAQEQYGIAMMFQPTTLTVEKGAGITASGSNAYALYYLTGTHDLYLNDTGLITLQNGAKGICIAANTTLNIYVPTAEAKAEYEAMVVCLDEIPSYTIHWYVNGSLVTD